MPEYQEAVLQRVLAAPPLEVVLAAPPLEVMLVALPPLEKVQRCEWTDAGALPRAKLVSRGAVGGGREEWQDGLGLRGEAMGSAG